MSRPGEPLQLIAVDPQTHKVHVPPETAACLRSIRTPVGVVAVCGRARTGKSYILNQILGSCTGFRVAHSHRPCTKGLWIWSQPFKQIGPDGIPYHLVLLDSEGIDAYDQAAQEGVQLLSLAVLLSSLFVFNQMGPIDEAALDRLSLVTEITRRIRIRASSSSSGGGSSNDVPEDSHELGGFNPSFVWLLRDFYFNMVEDGRKVSPREYLEIALTATPGNSTAAEAKNQIRASIKALFPDRDCFTLVRPMHDERQLNHLDELPVGQLRPEFQQGVAALTRMLLSRAQPKRIGSQIVTGPVLAGLAEAYCEAINAGAVPTISTAWQSVAEAECRRAAAAAEQAYRDAFQEGGVAPEQAALEAEHQRCLSLAKRMFKSIAVGDSRLRARYKQQLLEACEGRHQLLAARVLAAADAAADTLLTEGARRVSTACRVGSSPEEAQAQLEAFVAHYTAQAAGPNKWPKLVAWLLQQGPAMAAAQVARVKTDAAAQVAAAREAAHKWEVAAKTADGKIKKAEVRVADLVTSEELLRRQLVAERQHQGLGKPVPGCFACFGA